MSADLFSALADPTRRSIVELLAGRGHLTATEISDNYSISPQAISQHLKVLLKSNLVFMERRAQQRIYRMNPDALLELEQWAKRQRQDWMSRLDALEVVLKAQPPNEEGIK